MKITKQRLKEIIREELLTEQAAPGLGKDVRFTTVEGRDDAMTGADRLGPDIDKVPAQQEEEDFSREGGTPLERLLNRLLIRVEVDRFESAEEAAEWLGVDETDEELMGYLRKVMDDSFLAPMEEGR